MQQRCEKLKPALFQQSHLRRDLDPRVPHLPVFDHSVVTYASHRTIREFVGQQPDTEIVAQCVEFFQNLLRPVRAVALDHLFRCRDVLVCLGLLGVRKFPRAAWINIVGWPVVHISVQIRPLTVPQRIPLQEPPRRRRVVPRAVVHEARLLVLEAGGEHPGVAQRIVGLRRATHGDRDRAVRVVAIAHALASFMSVITITEPSALRW